MTFKFNIPRPRFVDSLWHDFRFALRVLRNNPGFAAVSILTLALGIGANTAIFSAVDALLLRPLPYSQPAQLVRVMGTKSFSPGIMAVITFSSDTWETVRKETPGIARIAMYDSGQFTLSGIAVPEAVSGAQVSGDFFPLLGVKPLLGRFILPTDVQAGSARVAVLTYKLWREVFAGDRGIIHKTILVNEQPYEVVGVMPRDFDLAATGRALWLPWAAKGNDSPGDVIVRMSPGLTVAALSAQLKIVSAHLGPAFHGLESGVQFTANPLRASGLTDLDRTVLILMGAVSFVLMIACLNVSNLLLARGWVRRKEFAIRASLGASRFQIIRQLLAESASLSAFGGILGLVIGVGITAFFRSLTPPGFLRDIDLRLDWRVLVFTFVLSLAAGLVLGLLPALQLSGSGLRSAMAEAAGSSATQAVLRGPHRLRGALVVFQVALAVVLVSGAALLGRSLRNLTAIDLGFRADHTLALSATLNKSACDRTNPQGAERCALTMNDILGRIHDVPEVKSAAASSNLPGDTALAYTIQIEGHEGPVGIEGGDMIAYRGVTPDYFQVLDIPFKAGRGFSSEDMHSSQEVAIVNESFARKYFDSKPLGRRISKHQDKDTHPVWMTIVGVVGDSHDTEISHAPVPEFYFPLTIQDDSFQGAQFLVRTGTDPMAIAAAVRSQVWAVDKNAPVEMRTLNDVVGDKTADPRFQTFLVSSFGFLGLLLAMVGLYGSISYGVSRRTHEIGIRAALGATPGNLLTMVIREGMALVIVGAVMGVAGALAMRRFLESFLFGLSATDPATYVLVSLVLALVAVLACYIPARRAAALDPVAALRHE